MRLHEQNGLASGVLLAAKHTATSPGAALLDQLQGGDLLLLGARPGMARRDSVWSLSPRQLKTVDTAGFSLLSRFGDRFVFDDANTINADYITNRLPVLGSKSRLKPGSETVVFVDYLQILDQNRHYPPLQQQVSKLKEFALEYDFIVIIISQIDRRYDLSTKTFPDLEDVRLVNPLNLSLFNKTCFLNNGEIQISCGD